MRQIYIVNATQVVVSESHPEGAYSTITGYPKIFDSETHNKDTEKALRLAQAEFYERWSALLKSDAPRAMYTVTLERSDGRQIEHRSFGAFPVEEEPEPTPEPETETVEEPTE